MVEGTEERRGDITLKKIAICDDDVTTLHQLKKYIEKYPIKLSIDLFQSGEALLKRKEFYEIILLDIDMKGVNGLEAAKRIREYDKTVKIIYITNYSDYTVFAFGVHAFAYLLKPVKEEQLYQQLDEAFEYMKQPKEEILEFMTEEGIVRTELHDILYFEYHERKVFLQTRDKRYSMKRKITELAAVLKEKGFVMPHKSFIVNLYAVRQIKGYDLFLIDDTRIPLSQKKSCEFRKALNCYLSEGGGGRWN